MTTNAITQEELNECDREPIHIPGAIQDHGLLFALTPDRWLVTHVSENIETDYGIPASSVLGMPLAKLIDNGQQERLSEILEDADCERANPIRIRVNLNEKVLVFDGVTHRGESWLILEMENPRSPKEAEMPKRRAADNHFQLIQNSLAESAKLQGVESVTDLMAREIKRFTGFDRVMVYRFAEDFHGEVIAEARNDTLEPFFGLHYPATDIPKQARELYCRNRLRLLHQVDAEPVRIVAHPDAETKGPLDLSLSVLRSLSPIHIQYLKNMGVSATMTISLLDEGRLWGLIACHHYDGAKFVPYEMRSACSLYGAVMSSEIVSKQRKVITARKAHLRDSMRQMVIRITASPDILGSLGQNSDVLMSLAEADGVAIIHEDKIASAGLIPPDEVSLRLIKMTEAMREDGVFVTDRVREALPSEILPETLGGLVVIELVHNWEIIFYREVSTLTTRWGGDPNKELVKSSPLTPRASFEEWIETTEGRSEPWEAMTFDLLHELRSSLCSLVFDRSRELKLVNEKLAERNAEVEQFVYTVSHDLKSPLVTCSGFVGMLTEDIAADDKESAADSLKRIQRSINRMSALIDELLEYSRIGKHLDPPSPINMRALIDNLREDFGERFAERDVGLLISAEPVDILGYEVDIIRCFENLLGNALKYGCAESGASVEIGLKQTAKRNSYFVKDTGPGIEPRYHEKIFGLFNRLDKKSEGTGVGLASVAKIMKQHAGSTSIDSALGEGACFWLHFPR